MGFVLSSKHIKIFIFSYGEASEKILKTCRSSYLCLDLSVNVIKKSNPSRDTVSLNLEVKRLVLHLTLILFVLI